MWKTGGALPDHFHKIHFLNHYPKPLAKNKKKKKSGSGGKILITACTPTEHNTKEIVLG